MFNFKYSLAFPQVGLQVMWPLKSWVRAFRGRCGTSARVWQPLPCWDAGCGAGVCRAVHLLTRARPELPLTPHTGIWNVLSQQALQCQTPTNIPYIFPYIFTFSVGELCIDELEGELKLLLCRGELELRLCMQSQLDSAGKEFSKQK